jgi:hypothetical protein
MLTIRAKRADTNLLVGGLEHRQKTINILGWREYSQNSLTEAITTPTSAQSSLLITINGDGFIFLPLLIQINSLLPS